MSRFMVYADGYFNLAQTMVFCLWKGFNALPNKKFLDVTKLKAFADSKLNVAKMTICLFDRVENTVGKRLNASDKHFLLFSQFSKAFFCRVVKSGNCVVKS